MSATPRTDAETRDVFDGDGELPANGSRIAPGGFYVTADFARQLERENAELRAALLKPNGEKLHEIMKIARKLSWMKDNPGGYPLMLGSEVEKCILMAIDDTELERFRAAAADPKIVKINAEDSAALANATKPYDPESLWRPVHLVGAKVVEYTDAELDAKVRHEGWDPAFVAEVKRKRDNATKP